VRRVSSGSLDHIREFIAKRISKKVADEVRIMYVPSFAWLFPSYSLFFVFGGGG
jgi:hypothetical protein